MNNASRNAPDTDIVALRNASEDDLETLLPLVDAYHTYEGIFQSEERRRKAVGQLLSNPALGEIKLIASEDEVVGYIAICFGYSIEFAGRDAFIDEFFLTEEARDRGSAGRSSTWSGMIWWKPVSPPSIWRSITAIMGHSGFMPGMASKRAGSIT